MIWKGIVFDVCTSSTWWIEFNNKLTLRIKMNEIWMLFLIGRKLQKSEWMYEWFLCSWLQQIQKLYSDILISDIARLQKDKSRKCFGRYTVSIQSIANVWRVGVCPSIEFIYRISTTVHEVYILDLHFTILYNC